MAYISFQPSDNYKTHLYNGTGSSQAITGIGFQPDVVWMKNRVDVRNHNLFDALRGVFMNFIVNTTAAEASATNSLTSFDSDGFTVQDSNETNEAGGDGYANWNWRMGTTTGIAGSPSITPTTYSFNATAGQSIIKYTGNGTAGATLPHGLGTSDIGMIIVKRIDGTGSWVIQQKTLGATKYLYLDATDAVTTSDSMWNDTEPTSTLFSLGSMSYVNGSSNTYMAYVFADVKGYSKFGSYTGNANADGPFCYTGFRPAFVMVKNVDESQAWNLWNDKTSTSGKNVADKNLLPNASTAEQTSVSGVKEIDILSNGFKIRGSNDEPNGSGKTIIYAAFAEFPFVSSNSIPTTAR